VKRPVRTKEEVQMRRTAWVWILLSAVALGTSSPNPTEAQDAFTRKSVQGPVTVTVTLAGALAPDRPIRVKVVLDTHSVALDEIALDAVVALRQPGGDVRPTAIEQAQGGGHHRQAVLVFPSQPLGDRLEVVVKNVGGVPERTFRWELPVTP